MKFVSASSVLRLGSARAFKSKAGKDLMFVKLIDVESGNFDSEEFLVGRDTDLNILTAGQNYEVVLSVEAKRQEPGFYVSANLYPVK